MKSIFLGIALMMCGVAAISQQEYFIFIQEAAGKPFYVRMGDESFSSSAGGHIILSQLKDSVYNLYIGFPRSRAAEQLFTITMGRKDHGYDLKNLDGRWHLFDLSTQQLILPVSTSRGNVQRVRRTDTYSELMANVVDDSAVLYFSPADTVGTVSVAVGKDSVAIAPGEGGARDTVLSDSQDVQIEPVKQKDSLKVMVPDTTAVAKSPAMRKDTTQTSHADVAPDSTSSVRDSTSSVSDTTSSVRDKRDIIRLRTENVSGGRLVIYVDRTGPVNDTIRIIIPRRL